MYDWRDLEVLQDTYIWAEQPVGRTMLCSWTWDYIEGCRPERGQRVYLFRSLHNSWWALAIKWYWLLLYQVRLRVNKTISECVFGWLAQKQCFAHVMAYTHKLDRSIREWYDERRRCGHYWRLAPGRRRWLSFGRNRLFRHLSRLCNCSWCDYQTAATSPCGCVIVSHIFIALDGPQVWETVTPITGTPQSVLHAKISSLRFVDTKVIPQLFCQALFSMLSVCFQKLGENGDLIWSGRTKSLRCNGNKGPSGSNEQPRLHLSCGSVLGLFKGDGAQPRFLAGTRVSSEDRTSLKLLWEVKKNFLGCFRQDTCKSSQVLETHGLKKFSNSRCPSDEGCLTEGHSDSSDRAPTNAFRFSWRL